MSRLRLGAISLASAMLILAGCGASTPPTPTSASRASGASSAAPAGPMAVSLVEWAIEAPATAAAGTTTLRVRNDGQVPHDLLVIRSDAAPRGLPTVSGRLDEARLDIVGRIGELTPGSGEEITVDLRPGKYILACNVIGHYNSGQAAALTVR